MSSNISFIVNTILLVIPIVGTIGVLLGIDAYREAAGQKPLFSDQATNTGTDHHENTPDNGIISMQFCDISYDRSSIHVSCFSSFMGLWKVWADFMVVNPNPWGVSSSTSGSLCMDVRLIDPISQTKLYHVAKFNNETYSFNAVPEFSVTWQYDATMFSQPVHAYPNARIDNILPLRMNDINQIYLNMHWTYGVGKASMQLTDKKGIKFRKTCR
ncbi:hypothetical protein N7450_001348 [Penicillium hetheringtonii]|uniref:Uncharacterized protein n=1 Tax=Penicillium hetheringtonii TaxID=911720 RepID=A0AAD6E4H3_9EURO|nr:hypothetical protein N7450_001348 [Penicillium hetheringtonii]